MKVLCFIGPSGVGKSTIINHLVESGIITLNPSFTDRPRRTNEIGEEHVYLTKAQFDLKELEGGFLGVVRPFNLPYRYGLSPLRCSQNTVATVILRVQFVPLLMKYYSEIVIYQIEAPSEFAKKNIEERIDINIGSRLKDYSFEINEGRKVAYRIYENDINNLDLILDKIKNNISLDFNNI